jgi:hypothetical protein
MIVFIGCGYRPTSYYAQHEIKGKIFVKLNINIDNTTNSVLIKDAVNEMILSQFGATITNNEQSADTIINISLKKVSFEALQDDNQGYAKLYRTTVSIDLSYLYANDKNPKKFLNVSGNYDYAVDNDSLITEAKKQESIKIAVNKALEEILSKVAIQTFKEDNKSKISLEKIRAKNVKNQSKSKSFFFFK